MNPVQATTNTVKTWLFNNHEGREPDNFPILRGPRAIIVLGRADDQFTRRRPNSGLATIMLGICGILCIESGSTPVGWAY
ncbi:hypothetical protein OE88DRAFT_1661900 [Heliocybe sulcata]|uniref:Uncharacterized protein n=1 Tax=Heliocybe sulcata TaxID=5364 RepID=A0A5C3MZE6_9AGAM|nr:hypothetical protein OE88DRAFT_1661900 [Heliocybe sulcata]